MGLYVQWRKRLPRALSILWRRIIIRRRRRIAGVGIGCGSLVMMLCCACACIAILAPSSNQQPVSVPAHPSQTQPVPTLTKAATLQPTETDTPTQTDIPPTNTKLPPTAQATNTSAPTIAPTKAQVVIPTTSPVQSPATSTPVATQPPPPTAAPAFTVIEFRSPVPVNGQARVVVQSTPGAQCFLSYYTPSGNVSKADGLGAKTADGNGICAWEWKIGSQTNPGTGSVVIQVGGITQQLPIVIQ